MRTQMFQSEDFDNLLDEVDDLKNMGPDDDDEPNDVVFDEDDNFELDSIGGFDDFDDFDDDDF